MATKLKIEKRGDEILIVFTSSLAMVSGSLRVIWLLPPLKLVAMI
jgi:hypothetical protein